MSKAKDAAMAFAANPPAGVTFKPASYKLIRAVQSGRKTCLRDYDPGAERVHAESEEKALQGVPFDAHEKGDLVVVVRVHRSYSISKDVRSESYMTWHVAKRATSARAEKQLVDLLNGGKPVEAKGQVWRITYAWLGAAHALLGQCFKSREELEAAMTDIVARKEAA
jgi:hypothetical protein